MAGEEFAAYSSGVGSIGSGIGGAGSGIANLTAALFGSKATTNENASTKGTVTEQLDISQAGVEKIIADLLGSEHGLAALFSEEKVAGLYNTSVKKQAAGDLLTKLAGEVAKLTAKKTVATDTSTTTEGKQDSAGLFTGLLG